MVNRSVFPATLNTDVDTSVKAVYLTIEQLQKTRDQALASAMSIINQHSGFFIAHYGTKPYESIYQTHIAPSGSDPLKQGGGPRGSLTVAQTIAAYQNPSAAQYGLTVEKIVGVLNAMIVIPQKEAEIASKQAELEPLIRDAVYMLEGRPSAEAIKSYAGKMKMQDLQYTQDGVQKLKYGYALYPKPVSKPGGPSITLYKPVDDYHIFPQQILGYYANAFKSPKTFWDTTDNHRLGVESSAAYGNGYYMVMIYKVNQRTGAPTGQTIPVARAPVANYQNNSGYFLSKVKQLYFPEMALVTDGVTSNNVDEATLYANAKDMWTGIPAKTTTPILPIVIQSFDYYGTNQLTSPDKERTSAPITQLKLMMQPEGTETAMKRILDINDPSNAIKKWVLRDLTGGNARDNADGTYTLASVTQSEINTIKKTYEYTVKGLYHILAHPMTYYMGIDYLYSMQNSPIPPSTDLSITALAKRYPSANPNASAFPVSHIIKVLEYAGWPRGQPQVIFETHIDDQNDAINGVRRFFSYMQDQFAQPPGTMYLPEAFNGRFVTKVGAHIPQAGGQAMQQDYTPDTLDLTFTVDTGLQYPFSFASIDTMVSKFQINQTMQTMTNYEIFVLDAHTVVSRRPIAKHGSIKLPQQLSPVRPGVGSASLDDVSRGATIAAVGFGAIILGLGLSRLG